MRHLGASGSIVPSSRDDIRAAASGQLISPLASDLLNTSRSNTACVSLSINFKVLLADSNPERAAAVEASLSGLGNALIVRVPAGRSIYDAVIAEAPDVIIVDMARPDRDAIDDLRRANAVNPRPIVMFVDGDDRSFMEEAIAAGVCSYNVVGAALPDVKPMVMAAVAIFRKYQQVAADLAKANTSLREREAVDQAKALLMRRHKFGEPEAYRWLRRRAMNENKRIAAVAAELLAKNSEGSQS